MVWNARDSWLIIVINDPGDGRPVIWSRPSVLTMASISLTSSGVYVLLMVPVVLPRKNFDGSAGKHRMEVSGQVRNY